MGDRIPVLTPDGKFGTIDAADAGNLPPGARVLTKQQQREAEVQQAYDQKSLTEKATSLASIAGPVPFAARAAVKIATGHGDELAPSLPPQMEAYAQGVSEGMTGGLSTLGMKEAVRLAGGDEAARAYAKTAMDVREAHSNLYGAGIGAGLIGGAVAGGPKGGLGALGKAIPGVAIGAIGEGVEQTAGRALAGVAERGVLGRAAAAAGSMGARGAAEGALYGAANYTGDALIQDHDLAAEKLFTAAGTGALGGLLAGGVLGGGGSLAKSGVKALTGGSQSTIARVLTRGGEEAGIAAETKGAPTLATEAAAAAESKAGAPNLLESIRGKATDQGVRELAYDRAWRATGGRKTFSAEANKYLPNGTNDVGEVLLRHGVIDTEGKFAAAAMNGTPAAIAERIEAPLASVGQRIGEITDNSGAKISARALDGAVAEVVNPLLKTAATAPAGEALMKYVTRLGETLGIKSLDDTVSVQSLLAERKALDKLVFENASLDPGLSIQIKRELRSKMEGLITNAMDEASGKVPGELKAEYRSLKHDYQALRIAQDASEDAATRGASNRTFSPTAKAVGIAVGAASHVVGLPGFVTGPMAAMATKVIQERGDAAAAVLLHRAADMGLVSKAMAQVDSAMGRASKGLLSAPKAIPLPEAGKTTEPVMVRAQKAMARVSEAQANPEAYMQRVTKQTEGLAATAPQLASTYVSTAARAMAFLASKQPVVPDRDPLDPHASPRPTPEQAHEFMRYVDYVDRPMKFFDDLERGKLTYEGAETARTLLPRAFAELQSRTAEALATELANGTRIPQIQREKIGLLLDFPATASQQPQHAAFLQGNVQEAMKPDNLPSSAPPRRPAQIKTQQSALDRLESR